MQIILPARVLRFVFLTAGIVFLVFLFLMFGGIFFGPECYKKTPENDTSFCRSFREGALRRNLTQLESVWSVPHDINSNLTVKKRYIVDEVFVFEYSTKSLSIGWPSRQNFLTSA